MLAAGAEKGSEGLSIRSPMLCEQHGEPQVATGFDFCLSIHS